MNFSIIQAISYLLINLFCLPDTLALSGTFLEYRPVEVSSKELLESSKALNSQGMSTFGAITSAVNVMGQQGEEDKHKRFEEVAFSNEIVADKSLHGVRGRSSTSGKGEVKKKMPKGKQKKAKVLGQLLMNRVLNKVDDEQSDDYIDDDDDDNYSEGLSEDKMNWEDYRNEDGSSVLELIALNARHKTRMQRANGDEYLY